jgi:hypothetical protein
MLIGYYRNVSAASPTSPPSHIGSASRSAQATRMSVEPANGFVGVPASYRPYRRRIDPQDIEIATRPCDPTYRRSASSAGSSLTLANGNSPPRGVKITEHSTIMGVF